MVFESRGVIAPYQCIKKVADVWQELTNGPDLALSSRVNSISVSNDPPFKYAIPNGRKVLHLYKCHGDKLCRKISGFGSRITCCHLRRDSKLVIAGEEEGTLRICTTDKNTYHLRKMHAHKGSVNGAYFFVDGKNAASVGSDAIVRTWDVTLGTEIRRYVVGDGTQPARALVVGRKTESFLSCGNFDGRVFIYDTRQTKPVHKLTVSCAVSALALNHSDEKLVIANGPSVHVWDLRAQQFLAHSSSDVTSENGLRLHYKLVTSLCVVDHPKADEGEVVLSVSMDKLAKITHLDKWTELYQLQCPLPLTAVGATPDCQTLLFGGEQGFVKIKHLSAHSVSLFNSIASTVSHDAKEEFASMDGLDPSFQSLAAEFSGRQHGHDQFIEMTTETWLQQPFEGPRRGPKDWLRKGERVGRAARRVPLIHETSEISRSSHRLSSDASVIYTRADRLLAKFDHSKALTVATRAWINRDNQSAISSADARLQLAVGVIRELIRRGTLAASVAGRGAAELSRLLGFIRKLVWLREYAPPCLELFNCIMKVYPADELALVPEFSRLILVLRRLSQNVRSLNTVVNLIKSPSEVQTDVALVGRSAREPSDTNNVEKLSKKRPFSLQKDATAPQSVYLAHRSISASDQPTVFSEAPDKSQKRPRKN